jgi:SAM-dependent methyltransferase
VLHVDEPADGLIAKRATTIQGWFLSRSLDQQLSLQLGGVPLTSVVVERPDASPLFGRYVYGFRAIADLDALALARPDITSETTLDLLANGAVVASRPLRLLSCNNPLAQASADKRAQKRQWLEAHLACPKCGSQSGSLEFAGNSVRCRACAASFEANGQALNFLPEDFKQDFKIGAWGEISAHDYDETAKAVIESVRQFGGKVLDCGSGLRPEVDDAVICLEVDAFPNVDVLAVNQKLPFRDASFDAVLSLNVLEHVTDPFACAAELVRVLKPGGALYCCIPFLQPEHGYPDHYFNATRSGLKQLFTGELEVLRHFVPSSGEPVWTLHWFLSWYVRELPAADQSAFLKMRVEDLLAAAPPASLASPWVAHLSENGKWRLASTTAALFRKPARA